MRLQLVYPSVTRLDTGSSLQFSFFIELLIPVEPDWNLRLPFFQAIHRLRGKFIQGHPNLCQLFASSFVVVKL
jgi:hypothetical protein